MVAKFGEDAVDPQNQTIFLSHGDCLDDAKYVGEQIQAKYGVQDVKALMKAAKHAGSQWLIVEQDQPSMGKTPLECVALSMETIEAIRLECGKGTCDHNHGEDCTGHGEGSQCDGQKEGCSGEHKHGEGCNHKH